MYCKDGRGHTLQTAITFYHNHAKHASICKLNEVIGLYLALTVSCPPAIKYVIPEIKVATKGIECQWISKFPLKISFGMLYSTSLCYIVMTYQSNLAT